MSGTQRTIPAPNDIAPATGPRGVLHVVHGHGGGTEHHARALIDTLRSVYRHYLVVAVGDTWQIEEHGGGGAVRTFEFCREPDETWSAFIGGLCATLGIGLIHLHNISGARDGLIEALATLGLPYGYTAHDLSFACPTILFLGADGRYCFEQTDAAVCGACLRAQPAFAHIDIEAWRARHRALLVGAAFLIAPSRWVASALERYFPGLTVDVIAHAAPGVWAMDSSQSVPAPAPVAREGLALPGDDVPTVAVLGAVGPDKGARQLERMAEIVRTEGFAVRFVLIGYMDVQHGPWQSEDAVLTVHGRYDPRDLPALLAHYRVRLVAFPSAGPETFSFTLSETWAAGLPVIVPPFGALAERVAGTGAGWLWNEAEWRDETMMVARILALVGAPNADALAAAAAGARGMVQPTLVEMAGRTLALYERTAALAPSGFARFSPARVRDALRCEPSAPPVDENAASARLEPGPVSATTPTSGLRHTLPGRLLSRFTPARVRKALRSRLR